MTDLELNQAISEALGWKLKPNFSLNNKSESKVYLLYEGLTNGKHAPYTFDYNNWNDLMPLVVEYGIQYKRTHIHRAKAIISNTLTNNSYSVIVKTSSDNPQRTLAECLLEVLTH